MDAASLALLITAVSGAGLGAAGFVQSRRRDTEAARATAQTVAAEVTDAGLLVLSKAMERQSSEISDLRLRVDDLTDGLARCEQEKAQLAKRVRELESAA